MRNGEALARTSDPVTSKIAAATVAGGRANELEQVVLDALRDNPRGKGKHPCGLTTHEICDVTGQEWNSISPRMKPLCKKGRIEVLTTVTERKGKPCIVWGLKQQGSSNLPAVSQPVPTKSKSSHCVHVKNYGVKLVFDDESDAGVWLRFLTKHLKIAPEFEAMRVTLKKARF